MVPIPLGPLHTRAKSCDHEIARVQKKVFKGRTKSPTTSCSVDTDPQYYKKPVFFVMSPIMSTCFFDVLELAINVLVNVRMSTRQ